MRNLAELQMEHEAAVQDQKKRLALMQDKHKIAHQAQADAHKSAVAALRAAREARRLQADGAVVLLVFAQRRLMMLLPTPMPLPEHVHANAGRANAGDNEPAFAHSAGWASQMRHVERSALAGRMSNPAGWKVF